VPPSEARITEITSRLAAVGLSPQRKEYADRTTIEAAIPPGLPDTVWPEVLAVLEAADEFGLNDSATYGRSLWAVITKSAPAATDAAGRAHPQP
jgi:hypothetical protein